MGTYSDHVVQIHRFVAMVMDFDSASQDVDEGLPLQVLREGTEAFPLAGEGLDAVSILFGLDFPCGVVPEVYCERNGRRRTDSFHLRLSESPLSVHPCSIIYSAYRSCKSKIFEDKIRPLTWVFTY